MQLPQEVFELFLPEGIFEWFEIKQARRDEHNAYITLEEKDIPPSSDKKILARKFHEITITDFPLRGKRTLLTFRRRYWRVAGQKEYLKRDIKLSFPGTQLEKEFANFLKDRRGDERRLLNKYCSPQQD